MTRRTMSGMRRPRAWSMAIVGSFAVDFGCSGSGSTGATDRSTDDTCSLIAEWDMLLTGDLQGIPPLDTQEGREEVARRTDAAQVIVDELVSRLPEDVAASLEGQQDIHRLISSEIVPEVEPPEDFGPGPSTPPEVLASFAEAECEGLVLSIS